MAGLDRQTGIAVACSISAMALFGLIDNFIRLAAETGSLWQFHLMRSMVALSLLWVVARVLGTTLRVLQPRRVAVRTFFAASAMVIYFGCLGMMPIAQAVAGLFTAPIFVVIFSIVIWREKIGPRRLLAVALGFAGIVLVLRPDLNGPGPITVLPIAAGAFHALGNLTTRRWCAAESTFGLLTAFFIAMMLIGAVGVVAMGLTVHAPPDGPEGYVFRSLVPVEGAFLWVTLVQGVGSLIGVGLMLRSYQLGDPALISVVENTLLVFATIWAVVLWGEVPGPVALVGLVLIVSAGLIVSARSEPAVTRPV